MMQVWTMLVLMIQRQKMPQLSQVPLTMQVSMTQVLICRLRLRLRRMQ
jgi:hypothetical protein